MLAVARRFVSLWLLISLVTVAQLYLDAVFVMVTVVTELVDNSSVVDKDSKEQRCRQ